MRQALPVIAVWSLVAACVALPLLQGVSTPSAGHPGGPCWALMTFAVAAFIGSEL